MAGLQVFGTITKTKVATGADLVGYSGFSASNYLQQPYNADLDFGTGDFCINFWITSPITTFNYPFQRAVANGGISMEINSSGQVSVYATGNTNYTNFVTPTGNNAFTPNVWTLVTIVRSSGNSFLYLNGKVATTGTSTVDLDFADAPLRIGSRVSGLYPVQGSMALFRISATAPSPEQIKKIYDDEKVLFQENAKAVLYGSSDAVTALAYDDSNGILSVGTSAGRSDFQGLRRVNNTTNAVGAAISASNGLIVEE